MGSFLSVAVLMIVAMMKLAPVKTWLPDFKFLSKTLTFGLKVYVNHISWLILHAVDRYMIAYMIPNSDRDLGYYAVASQLSAALWILPQSLQAAFLPHLSVTTSNKEQLTVKTVRIIFIALLPIFIGCIIFSPLISVILGEKYILSIVPFRILIIGIMFYGSTRPLSSYLIHQEKPKYDTLASWMGSGLNVGLNWFLIPKMGISGAAMASSASAIFMGAVLLGCFVYETKLPLRSFLIKRSDFREIFKILSNLVSKIKMPADKIRD
jgi:O-antigen/teichoic acid export membrane protein